MRSYRAARKAARAPVVTIPEPPADPVDALAAWATEKLVVPPGHPAAGEPMTLPDFAEDFLRAGYFSHESALSVARKNGKSAIIAVLALGHLCGPLRSAGWRGAIASISKEKSAELRKQVADIAEASGLDVTIRRSPYPGSIESSTGVLETLSADKNAGHASGFDLVVVDETGLMPERARDLLAGLRSSVSAKNGRLVHISVRGAGLLFREILDNPETVSRVYAAPDKCDLTDEAAWAAANPSLGSIKSIEYMRSEVARLAAAPSDEPSFRAFDLNQELSPTREMVVNLAQWRLCANKARPARSGDAFVGIDLGGSTSMTAATAFWPESGRLDCWGAFGGEPSLADRGKADAVGNRYERMEKLGELRTFGGRVTPVQDFLKWLAAELDGEPVARVIADRYRRAESLDALAAAGIVWPAEWRAVGSGQHGSSDIRDFQRAVEGGALRPGENLVLESAISAARLRHDANGNPSINKSSGNSRIDALAAAVLAVGAGSRSVARPAEEFHFEHFAFQQTG